MSRTLDRVGRAVGRTFHSLRVRNYRLYFFAQAVSQSGTWMQSVAQGWLVLHLTGSALLLSVTVALQFGPVLFIGPWGGLLADRTDKRKLLIATQTIMTVLAVVLGVLTVTGVVRVWMIFVLAALNGVANGLDNPARQSFVIEMVGPDDVANAVALNSVVVNASRVIGPAIAGVLIVTVGLASCFLVNAGSYLFVIVALVAMRPSELRRGRPLSRKGGQLRAGFAYVWHTPELRVPLTMMALVGTLGYNFSILLPLMARVAFHRGAGTYGALVVAMGVGALAGGLYAAARARPSRRLLWRRDHGGRGHADPQLGAGRAGAARRLLGALRGDHQLAAAVELGGSHAGPCDVAVGGRLFGLHAVRQSDHRRPRRPLRPACGLRRRGRGDVSDRRRGLRGAAPAAAARRRRRRRGAGAGLSARRPRARRRHRRPRGGPPRRVAAALAGAPGAGRFLRLAGAL
jgi:MFS family permease